MRTYTFPTRSNIEEQAIACSPTPPAKPWSGGTVAWTFTGFDAAGSQSFRDAIESLGGPEKQFASNTIFNINGSSAKKALLANNMRHTVTSSGAWLMEREPSPWDDDQHTQMEPVDMPSPATDGL